ncbi:3-oxoacyl-[acyl-carrier-protein] synthase 2 [mine drainage metagenome]|uniref:3-oxoacyl-[acyl-carrier-protein] synthase 2 n=1 Tax=mine drainage metagenome TaxID=410659 RepID=A0A1J5SNN8_9ZZZZ
MRLFLTACGVVCPLGHGVAAVARRLAAGRPAFTSRADLIPGRTVPVGMVSDLPAGAESRNNRLMAAALDEIAPAVAAAARRFGPHRLAVVLGTSTSGIAEGEQALMERRRTGAWPRDFLYTRQETGSLADFAARHLGLSGPAYVIATACSSSAKVFASARRLIRLGLADAAVVGGADSLCRMTLNGFNALEALSGEACRPFSRHRDGITIGEGAAAFLLSPDPGAVELLGAGESSDAHHATAPHPEGDGARLSMAQALAEAGLAPDDIAYINLHGTATPLNDAMEAKAVAALFPPQTWCGSTKGMTGHMLGGTGAVEAAFLWLCLDPGTGCATLPPHVWDGAADPLLPPLRLVPPGTALPAGRPLVMLSNSFGFGGSNLSLILGRTP